MINNAQLRCLKTRRWAHTGAPHLSLAVRVTDEDGRRLGEYYAGSTETRGASGTLCRMFLAVGSEGGVLYFRDGDGSCNSLKRKVQQMVRTR